MESRQDIYSQTKKEMYSVCNYLRVLATDNIFPEYANFFSKTCELTCEKCGF